MWISLFILTSYAQTPPVDASDNATYVDIYLPIALPPPPKYGTTYGFDSYTAVGNNQVLRVGCSGTPYIPIVSPYNPLSLLSPPYPPGQGQCNPYKGDTPCYFYLPILCINSFGAFRPNYPVNPWTDFFNGWTEGILALTTTFYQGSSLFSLANANFKCYQEFGPGWRMARFNEGFLCNNGPLSTFYQSSWPGCLKIRGGWHYYGWGVLNPVWTRFWIYVRNQPSNCF